MSMTATASCLSCRRRSFVGHPLQQHDKVLRNRPHAPTKCQIDFRIVCPPMALTLPVHPRKTSGRPAGSSWSRSFSALTGKEFPRSSCAVRGPELAQAVWFLHSLGQRPKPRSPATTAGFWGPAVVLRPKSRSVSAGVSYRRKSRRGGHNDRRPLMTPNRSGASLYAPPNNFRDSHRSVKTNATSA
jgi:hypothetical protein